MIFLGILLSIAAIGFFCWLLFTLVVFALPFFAGITAGAWAHDTGAGWLGAILVGVVAAGLTLGIGQVLLGIVRPLWARMLIALAFVAPAASPHDVSRPFDADELHNALSHMRDI